MCVLIYALAYVCFNMHSISSRKIVLYHFVIVILNISGKRGEEAKGKGGIGNCPALKATFRCNFAF